MTSAAKSSLPASVLALFTTAFLTILTETMPAAVMPQMTAGLDRSQAAIGMLVSVYALASAIAAIPIVALTQAMSRKRLYVILLLSFALCNAVTSFSHSYALTTVSRIGAGLTAGVAWPVVVGFAMRLGQGKNVGKAVAITLAGSTVAMVAGLPLGSLLGSAFGWRLTFSLLSAIAVLLIVWVWMGVPDAPAEKDKANVAIRDVVKIPGLVLILLATLFGIGAHYAVYTYIAPVAAGLKLPGTTQALLLFGGGALAGILVIGRLVDRRLRILAIAAPTLAILAWAFLLLVSSATLAGLGILLWGLAFGGLPTIFQAAVARAAQGGRAELATAMLTTTYNVGIFLGGAVGGVLLGLIGLNGVIAIAIFAISATLTIVLVGRAAAFPAN